MTPKEKANELFGKYYSRIEHTLSEEYSPHERFIVKQCAFISVDDILTWLKAHSYSNKNYDAFVFYNEVKQEIENL